MELSRIDLTRFDNVGDNDGGGGGGDAVSIAPLETAWPPSSISVMQNLCEVDDDEQEEESAVNCA